METRTEIRKLITLYDSLHDIMLESIKHKWEHCFIDGKQIQNPKNLEEELNHRIAGAKILLKKLKMKNKKTLIQRYKSLYRKLEFLREKHSELLFDYNELVEERKRKKELYSKVCCLNYLEKKDLDEKWLCDYIKKYSLDIKSKLSEISQNKYEIKSTLIKLSMIYDN